MILTNEEQSKLNEILENYETENDEERVVIRDIMTKLIK